MSEASSPSTTTRTAPDTHLLGATLMIGGALVVPIMDLLGKALGHGAIGPIDGPALWVIGAPMPALQVGWGRFAFQTIFMALILLATSRRPRWAPQRLGLVLLRGGLIAIGTVAFFAALQVLGLAEAIAIFFVEPLLLTVLSALVLREKVGWRRGVAILGGLIGAMLIIQPNFLKVGWSALLPLLTAVCFACYLLLTRVLAERESAVTLQLWAGLVGATLLSAVLGVGAVADIELIRPIEMTWRHWLVLIAMAFAGAGGHLIITNAFRYAQASALAPLQYFEILSASVLGYFFFNETLDRPTLIGLALIIGAGLFVLRRERELSKRASAPEPIKTADQA
ncbi:MAG: DMT family transporter [Neomegalonema sp.]|nr:DMT family transporter [Neomegalonema sp.]